MKKALSQQTSLTPWDLDIVLSLSRVSQMEITGEKLDSLGPGLITVEQKRAIELLRDQAFRYQWQLADALAGNSSSWRFREDNQAFNAKLSRKLEYVYDMFQE